MTRRVISARPTARHVIDRYVETLFIESHGHPDRPTWRSIAASSVARHVTNDTQVKPSFLESNGVLTRGEQYLSGPDLWQVRERHRVVRGKPEGSESAVGWEN